MNAGCARSTPTARRSCRERTFCNYRAAAEELFGIEIKCNPVTFEYYIEEVGDGHSDSVNDWLLNSAVTNEVLAGSRDVAARILWRMCPRPVNFSVR